jgi:hypothetical protein
VHKVQQDLLAQLVHRESLVLKELLALKVFKVLPEQQGHKAHKEAKE